MPHPMVHGKTMKETGESCCPVPGPLSRCTLEAILSVDERGQMVLPKELRARAGIAAGTKLAAVGWEKNGEVCCIMLLKVERLNESVKTVVGPMVNGVLSDEANR
ncbi:MAG: HgcAB-associated protein [Methanomicrobiales archaeon]|nr:HgcAB-associated protein [Methanomicrobiales archaeon]